MDGGGDVTGEIPGFQKGGDLSGAWGEGDSVVGTRNKDLFVSPGTVSSFQQPWRGGSLLRVAEEKQEAQRG